MVAGGQDEAAEPLIQIKNRIDQFFAIVKHPHEEFQTYDRTTFEPGKPYPVLDGIMKDLLDQKIAINQLLFQVIGLTSPDDEEDDDEE
jgi:hypothetical protein